MANGHDVLALFRNRLKGTLHKLNAGTPDFTKCPLGAEHAQSEFETNKLFLEWMLLQIDHGHGAKRKSTLVPAMSWSGVAGTLAYLILKAHGLL